ncbi:MAG: hypothetical protein SWO11_02630 [Thermodesulfobacteriota bacterium]|nr:hypothetical protein [Thermodesulfobacteriota bacterium]
MSTRKKCKGINRGWGFSLILVFIATIYCTPADANTFRADSVSVRFNTNKPDKDVFRVSGNFEGISFDELDSITLEFGSFSETVPFSSFFNLGSRFIYIGEWGKSGISWLVFNTKKAALMLRREV